MRRILLLVGAMVGPLGLAVVCFPRPPVVQFMHHDQGYFRNFARACDTLLQQHPLGTNARVRLSGDDASLPPIIRDLRYGVDRVIVSTNFVFIVVSAPYHGFGITWQPQNENETNVWKLVACCESQETLAYAEQR